ncbi:MAG TPA: 2-phospho-L-lactate transferase CofD family protein [Candidatus Binataceae bacterium]|nr:2-phospho-L-lactate transferase CofD family protein [Candidatus Binataceae bacterium]
MATKIALFCGGRGSATIVRELLRTPDVQLALLVNAYDDGLSTGALRNFIPGMLGPSDFRKNFSYLLDLYSDEQYALKNLIEFRLPLDFGKEQVERLGEFAQSGNTQLVATPLSDLLGGLNETASDTVRGLLKVFFDYANGSVKQFDFRDCAVGNLLFAGAYLSQGGNFNAASEVMSRLVSSQAVLVNVSSGENRILVALKEDGELLSHEVEIVGPQSPVPIRNIFFLAEPLSESDLEELSGESVAYKESWLAAHESLPEVSEEARRFLRDADLIVYGPGTQHSSLFPSYRIAGDALRTSRAAMKVFVANLAPDHDIQGLMAKNLVDRALTYMGDPENTSPAITNILIPEDASRRTDRLEGEPLAVLRRYKNATVVRGPFKSDLNPQAHNGHAVVSRMLDLRRRRELHEEKPSLEIFYDLSRRPAGDGLVEEFLEFQWPRYFRRVVLRVHGKLPKLPAVPPCLAIEEWRCDGSFPEVSVTADWLRAGGSDYLATITGDGEYRLRDIAFGVKVLEQGPFGAVYGSRTQSRRQFNSSLRAAYGERGLAYRLSFAGAFILSMLHALRFGVIFSDPMTGFRVYSRAKLDALENLLAPDHHATPMTITKLLVQNRIEIAELPVQYRTFAGFTDPKWRLRRGFANLMGILR